MLLRSIVALGIAIAALVLGLSLGDILSSNTNAWTDTASQNFSCSTGAATSCALTLSSAHAFPSTSGMTVSETSPSSVDRTSASTLSVSRLVVTVSGLSTSTTYNFTVAYLSVASTVSESQQPVFRVLPQVLAGLLVALIGVALAAFLYGVVTGALGRRRRSTEITG